METLVVFWSLFIQTDDTLSNKTREIYSFKEKPSTLYWERNENVIRVIDQEKIISFTSAGTMLDTPIIVMPKTLISEKAVALWLDQEDQKLRIATWITIEPEQIQNNLIRLDDVQSVEVMMVPEWGWHAFVRLFKFDGNKWDIEHTLPMKAQAGDTPGLSVLKPFWKEQGTSNLKLSAKKYCDKSYSIYVGRNCKNGRITDHIKNDLNDSNLGVISCNGCQFDFIHSIQKGDNFHAVFPIHLRELSSDEIKHLPLGNKQQFFANQKKNFVFTESEKELSIIDLSLGILKFQTKGEGAFWLPNF